MNKRQLQERVQELALEKAGLESELWDARRERGRLRGYRGLAKTYRQIEADLLTLGLIPEEFIRPADPVDRHLWSYDFPRPEEIREEALREAADLVRAAKKQKLDKKRLKELETYRQDRG